MDIQKSSNKTHIPKAAFQEDMVEYVHEIETTIDVDELSHLNTSTGELIDIDLGDTEKESDERILQSSLEGTEKEKEKR